MKKNLVLCPTCNERGTKSFLGEMENGTFSVMRFHQAFTRIVGSDYAIYCSHCNEPVFIHQEPKQEIHIQRIAFTGTIL